MTKPLDHAGMDLTSYDNVIVAFSGGKDSLACLLHLMECGVPLDKLEAWHHDIDGHGDSLMDWPCTPDYCRVICRGLGVPLYFSWRMGGFLREMMRNQSPTAPVEFETPDGEVLCVGGKGPAGTRLKFPQMSADLSVRWCSAYLKIDVAARAITNQPRFTGKRVLLVTGERAEESGARSRYPVLELHKTSTGKRTVHQYRPVHAWTTAQVWSLIAKYKVNPHPCYRLGWGRCSCACCIFGNKDQWASIAAVNPAQFERVAAHEAQFGVTIRREGIPIKEYAAKGKPYAFTTPDIAAGCSLIFDEPAILENWVEPLGAKADLTGPC